MPARGLTRLNPSLENIKRPLCSRYELGGRAPQPECVFRIRIFGPPPARARVGPAWSTQQLGTRRPRTGRAGCKDVSGRLLFCTSSRGGGTSRSPHLHPRCPRLLPLVCLGPAVTDGLLSLQRLLVMLKLTGSKPYPPRVGWCFRILEGGVCSLHHVGQAGRLSPKCRFSSGCGAGSQTLHFLHPLGKDVGLVPRTH